MFNSYVQTTHNDKEQTVILNEQILDSGLLIDALENPNRNTSP